MPLLEPDVDSEQYTAANVAAYEVIYGRDFISPGGKKLASHFSGMLELQPGEKVLDVGSGLGGCAFTMAEEFQARVVGLDFSSEMVEEATNRCRMRGLQESVRFEREDCLRLQVAEEYDAVISRDVFLHIADKQHLFKNLYRALKPGGRILFTDYLCREKPWPWAFTHYVKTRNYTLHTLEDYATLLRDAEFSEVKSEDITQLFIDTLREEIGRAKSLPWHKRAAFKLGWNSKLRAANKGVHRWGVFQAKKPG